MTFEALQRMRHLVKQDSNPLALPPPCLRIDHHEVMQHGVNLRQVSHLSVPLFVDALLG